MRTFIPHVVIASLVSFYPLHAEELENDPTTIIVSNDTEDTDESDIIIPPSTTTTEIKIEEARSADKTKNEDLTTPKASVKPKVNHKPIVAFSPFTGKVTKNKVRMRALPNLESAIIRELNKDEMLIVTGENDEFYSVKPPMGTKAYVYRTYVLDGTVEGSRINVRLEPDTDAIVLAQLSGGEKVSGDISPLNSKWMEIEPPESVQFYVCKEYVEKIGDPQMMAQIDRRRAQVNELLESTYTLSKMEMLKPFEQITLDEINRNLEKIVSNYSEFHEQVGRAKTLQQSLKEDYLQKKIAYLENKAQSLPQLLPEKRITQSTTTTSEPTALASLPPQTDVGIDAKIAPWLVAENSIFSAWSTENQDKTLSDFYEQQRHQSTTLRGIIEPYSRPVRNKPGDYVLLNRISRLPVAFLYSTVVNLENYADQEITIHAVERPNNNFAFPAYFVLTVE